MFARSALPPVIAIAAVSALLAGCTSTKSSGSGGKDISLVNSGK
ncbi:ABC transporter substrate-binding protein, partial [Streptomyces albiflaviniger]|nr:ABC transporter substrate-binding protein [Streptomyces albiflaviniger]